MNSHQNARTTLYSRVLMVTRVLEQSHTPARVAEELGISVRTVYKWLARYKAEGRPGLANRPSVAHRCPHQLCPERVRLIEHLRRDFRLTIRQIAQRLSLAFSTVAATLKRLGLNRLKLLEPKEPIRRYERKHPGDLIHLDIKKLARFWRTGHRITGNRRINSSGAGWEYVHVCIDDHSRLAYVEILPNERSISATAFLKRAVAWFKAQGVTVHRVMTDNGACYISKDFTAASGDLGLRHLRTRPYTPKTNGRADPFIQTLLREWVHNRARPNSAERSAQLPRWLNHYNHRRPHGGIGLQPPITRIQAHREQRS